MKLLFLTMLFAYSMATGTGLQCFQCGMSHSICGFKTMCAADESCFTRSITTSSGKLSTSGCTKNEMCGKHVTEVYDNVGYPTVTDCCDVDSCNGASAVQASMLAIPVMVLAWFLAF